MMHAKSSPSGSNVPVVLITTVPVCGIISSLYCVKIGSNVTLSSGARLVNSIVLLSETQCPASSHSSNVMTWIPSLNPTDGAVNPFPVNTETPPSLNQPSMDEVHVKVKMSSSRSHESDALNSTSPCDGKMAPSCGEVHIKNGSWLAKSRRQYMIWSESRTAVVELLTLSYPQLTVTSLWVEAPVLLQRCPMKSVSCVVPISLVNFETDGSN